MAPKYSGLFYNLIMVKNIIKFYSSLEEANKADVEGMLSMSETQRIEYFRELNIRAGFGDSEEEARASHQRWLQFIHVGEKRYYTESEFRKINDKIH
jgi:hypothetical protein